MIEMCVTFTFLQDLHGVADLQGQTMLDGASETGQH